MGRKIEAIFLDTGNTLRVVEKNTVFQTQAQQELATLLEVRDNPAGFYRLLDDRYQEYKKWVKETLIEPSELEFWTRWMLPNISPNKITANASQLTRLWVDSRGQHLARPDARKTILELTGRGYILGVIANSISLTEIPDWLVKENLAQYFKVVLPSSKFGHRKPDPSIFIEAARLAGVEPRNCAYVGDNPSRDIEGTRLAGFGMAVILLEKVTLQKEPPRGRNKPDGIVGNLGDLLQLFPSIKG